MLELNPEFRRELVAARAEALHRSAEPSPPGPFRRAIGSSLVRLGLRLGYDGRVPPFVAQLVTEDEPPFPGGGLFLRSVREPPPRRRHANVIT